MAFDAQVSLLDLLSVIHRDGGQHSLEVGLHQSCKDAKEVVRTLRERIAEWETIYHRKQDDYFAKINVIHKALGGADYHGTAEIAKQRMDEIERLEKENRQLRQTIEKWKSSGGDDITSGKGRTHDC